MQESSARESAPEPVVVMAQPDTAKKRKPKPGKKTKTKSNFEPVLKPLNWEPEPVPKPGNREPEPVPKPGNREPVPVNLEPEPETEVKVKTKKTKTESKSKKKLGPTTSGEYVQSSEETSKSKTDQSTWSKLFVTREMEENRHTTTRDGEVLIMLRELIIYLMFLTLLLIISVGMQGTTMFTHRKAMANLFLYTKFQSGERKINFRTATHMTDFWAYAEKVLIDGLLWDNWYERNPDKSVAPTEPDDKKILYENKLLGLARIRQLRVRPQSCTIHDDFRRTFFQCWAFYSEWAEDKEPFGDGTGTAWTYSTAEDLQGIRHAGLLATYGAGGFYQDIVLDYKQAQDSIAYLKQKLWVTQATRAIFMDFTVYNANVNIFCVCKLVMEFPPTGGVVPSWSIRTAKLLRYVRPFEYFVLCCELLYLGFIAFYTLEELSEIIYFKWEYFKHFWNIVDLSILSISYVCIIFSIVRIFTVKAALEKLLEDEGHYEDFSSLGYWNMQYLNAVAVLVFISWIKIFKYISFNQTMSQLSNTLSRCAGDIAGFGVMFFIVFCAFAQLGYLIFGTQVAGFSSWERSVITLLRTILGDFDYEAIENANRVLGPIFFLLYIFFVFFVLLNMFLAIINDTYAEVKSEIANRPAEIEVLTRGWNNLKRCLCCLRRGSGEEPDVMSSDYLRNMLKKSNFSDFEVNEFFKRYGIDTPMVKKDAVRKMLADYYKSHDYPNGDENAEEVDEDKVYDIGVLEDRCRKMEVLAGHLNDRLEMILRKMERQRKKLDAAGIEYNVQKLAE